ncbi:uncharacterized protein LOC130453193 isoform X2 [Diorhabda sublineata]|uniref:uncharacterized protein LOC130453193 isoform X2 n=1 Tax=Diorhabda sublineata TaxID=1163346 RepID=UPI0024E0D847|nr:uncharacterized protein LOC130453193 isoform X2 [Diorhabda sublineata]
MKNKKKYQMMDGSTVDGEKEQLNQDKDTTEQSPKNKEEVNELLEKPVANDKIKRNSQVFGMGDFDYGSSSDVPVTIKNEDEEFDQISRKTNNLFAIIESELAASFEEESFT